MPHVSVTRLRLRKKLYAVPFMWKALRINRQAQRAAGFVIGLTAYEPSLCFWTLTMWDDAAAMKAFRNAGAHMEAMKKLLTWCDEASYGNWEQAEAALPELAEAHRRMLEQGKPSKVKSPSPAHAERQVASATVPRAPRKIRPAKASMTRGAA